MKINNISPTSPTSHAEFSGAARARPADTNRPAESTSSFGGVHFGNNKFSGRAAFAKKLVNLGDNLLSKDTNFSLTRLKQEFRSNSGKAAAARPEAPPEDAAKPRMSRPDSVRASFMNKLKKLGHNLLSNDTNFSSNSKPESMFNDPQTGHAAGNNQPRAYPTPRMPHAEYEAKINGGQTDAPQGNQEPEASAKPRMSRAEYEAKINGGQTGAAQGNEEPKAYSKPRMSRAEYEAKINGGQTGAAQGDEEPKAYSKPRMSRAEYEAKINEEKSGESGSKDGAHGGSAKTSASANVGQEPVPQAKVKPLYAQLGISADADSAAIKKAYRMGALKNHPDKNPNDPQATAKFQQFQNANDILSDPRKRAAYDQGLINEQGQYSSGAKFE